jgi:lysozyme family protein
MTTPVVPKHVPASTQQYLADLIAKIIQTEGGYTDHPADRGGPTIWGITEHVARAYGYTGPMQDMHPDTAADIYRTRYWYRPNLHLVAVTAPELAAQLLDIGVNMGSAAAAKLLQRTLNALNQGGKLYPDVLADGNIGPLTLHCLSLYLQRRGPVGLTVLLTAINALQGAAYIGIAEGNPSQEAFTYGWLSRLTQRAAGV